MSIHGSQDGDGKVIWFQDRGGCSPRRWALHAAELVCSHAHSDLIESIYVFAARNQVGGLLRRAILSHDIEISGAGVRQNLARNLFILSLILCKDYNSSIRREFHCESSNGVVAHLKKSLQDCELSLPFEAEVQLATLIRVLFEFSGGEVNNLHRCIPSAYTANANADLLARFLGITDINPVTDLDWTELHSTIMQSRLFTGSRLSQDNLEEWVWQMIAYLNVDFQKGYLNVPHDLIDDLYPRDSFQLNVEQMYSEISILRSPTNTILFLLCSIDDLPDPQVRSLRSWARSDNGFRLYTRLIRNIRVDQTVEQLTLNIVGAWRLLQSLPYYQAAATGTVQRSHLVDFDFLLTGQWLGNGQAVFSQMIRSLQRVLTSTGQYPNLLPILAINDTYHSLLYQEDGLTDQYVVSRTTSLSGVRETESHESAMTKVLNSQHHSLLQVY